MNTIASYFQHSRRLIGAALPLLRDGHRYELLASLEGTMRFLRANRLPSAYLCDLWPVSSTFMVDLAARHHFELPYGERAIIGAIAQIVRPSLIFELGTFTGATTRLLADAVPDAEVHTIDLPGDEITFEPWIADAIGLRFRDDPGNITQHRCNTRSFDFGPYEGKTDLVFVDASHAYEDVLHDSGVALRLVSPRGVVVWDDYHAEVPGVVKALNEVSGRVQLVRIARSRLVVHRAVPFPGVPETNPAPWLSYPQRGQP